MANVSDVTPEGWTEFRQGDVVRFYNGRAYKLTEWEAAGTPVIRLQNLTGSGKEYYYSNLELPAHQYCNSGDLLYMWSATFGPHIWKRQKAIYHYHIWKVVPDEINVTKHFLFQLLGYKTNEWLNQSNGMGILHITKGGMEDLRLTLPPLPEQQKIATILSSVDDVIEKTRAQIDKLKDLKTGMMQELLTKGIGHTEFKDSPVGRIPVGWEVMQLGKLDLDISDGNYSAKYPKSTDFKEQGVAFIRANNIKKSALVWDDMRFISEEQHSDLRKGHLKKDDIIITTRGEVGSVAMVTDSFVGANINAQIVRINTSPYIYPEYFYYYLQQNQVKEQIYGLETGTALRQLPVGNLKQLLVALPQLSEQRMIAGALGSNQKKSIALSLKLKGFLKIKKALMQDLLTGKVRVNLTDKESAAV